MTNDPVYDDDKVDEIVHVVGDSVLQVSNIENAPDRGTVDGKELPYLSSVQNDEKEEIPDDRLAEDAVHIILEDNAELEKSTVLLLGPTGSRKTLLPKTLSRFVNVSFVIAEATTLTQAGYVGEDVPEKGTRKHSRGDNIQIDTEDILFICGGAFIDLEKTISERRQDSSIGFGAPARASMRVGGITNATVRSSLLSSLLESVESSDLIAYGFIPEFVGRFPILVSL